MPPRFHHWVDEQSNPCNKKGEGKCFLMSDCHHRSVISPCARHTCISWLPASPPPFTRAHFKYNASHHMQGRVTICYLMALPNPIIRACSRSSLPYRWQLAVYCCVISRNHSHDPSQTHWNSGECLQLGGGMCDEIYNDYSC